MTSGTSCRRQLIRGFLTVLMNRRQFLHGALAASAASLFAAGSDAQGTRTRAHSAGYRRRCGPVRGQPVSGSICHGLPARNLRHHVVEPVLYDDHAWLMRRRARRGRFSDHEEAPAVRRDVVLCAGRPSQERRSNAPERAALVCRRPAPVPSSRTPQTSSRR